MNPQKNKGSRVEREIVHLHRDMGIDAKRVPLSGAAEGFKGDVIIGDMVSEVKSRKGGQGFATISRWLGDNDLLFVKEDRKEPLVVMPWKTYEKLIKEGIVCPKCKGKGVIEEGAGYGPLIKATRCSCVVEPRVTL